MRSVPYVVRPRMFTDLLLGLEVPFLAFLGLAIAGALRPPVSLWWSVLDIVIFGSPALIMPLWWWSRRLTVTSEGVGYTPIPWFYPTTFIPYSEMQAIKVEGTRMQERGTRVMIYRLSILGSKRRTIQVTMYYYTTAELRAVVETILAHSGHVRLQGQTNQLLDGTETFAKR